MYVSVVCATFASCCASLYNKPNIGNRTPLSDGRKKEIYRDIRFFHGALQFPDFQDGYSPGGILETGFGFGKKPWESW